jgi:hypothetical protein
MKRGCPGAVASSNQFVIVRVALAGEHWTRGAKKQVKFRVSEARKFTVTAEKGYVV